MNTNSVRVRFAPSPTGHLHIGSLRTAIFNWLFARHHNGVFLLRIEDTDVERSKSEYTEAIFDALEWQGIKSDEPVVIQTHNLPLHKRVVQELLEQGKVYRCFCSIEHVEQMKEEQLSQGKLIKYDGACRNKKPTAQDMEKPFVIRFKLPYDKGPITFDDIIRGPVTVDADQLEDFIIVRSDGTPMYNFVVVVDDAAMKITHVIRGEDHISNTPKQVLLYQACGYTLPQFAHIPLILGPSGDRLSKRDGAVSAGDYRAQGYLPQALFNYLVRLGWSHGDQEIFTIQELIAHFSLDHVGKKGSIFDKAKLDWVNGVYIRQTQAIELQDQIIKYIEPQLCSLVATWSSAQLLDLIDIYKERSRTLKELVQNIIDIYPVPKLEPQQVAALASNNTVQLLEEFVKGLEHTSDFSSDALSAYAQQFCRDHSVKLPVIAHPIRYALTGKKESPGIFHLISILKKQESIRRLSNFVRVLDETTNESRIN